MFAVCENKDKKRRVEKRLELYSTPKRKFSQVETSNKKECCKFKKVNEYIRHKLYKDNKYNEYNEDNKDNYYCLIHQEKYICDIYECRGVDTFIVSKCDYIPYIV